MASYAVFPALHFAPVSLQAICDLQAHRAKRLASKFGAGRWYTDYREMLENENLEAVLIQMHPNPRQRIVQDVLKSGKHVFIPKPPASSYQQAIELFETARDNSRCLMVNFQSRFSYGVRQALKLVKQPDFGKLTQYLGSFCSGSYDEKRSRLYNDAVHAFLLDFTVHHLDLARCLAGEVSQMALYHNQLGDSGAYSLAVDFESGAVGSLHFNSHRLWWRNYDRIELTGQEQYIVLEDLWKIKHYTKARNTFTENYRDERSGELTGDAYALIEFVSSIREEREPLTSIHDAIATMKLYQALYEAVRAGKQGVVYKA